MEHKPSSSVGYRIPKAAAIAVLLAFLSIIALLWVHIKRQETIIFELHSKLTALEHREATNELEQKIELRRLSLEELFRRMSVDTVHQSLR